MIERRDFAPDCIASCAASGNLTSSTGVSCVTMMIARAMRGDVIDAWMIAASHVTRALRCGHLQRIVGRKIFIAIMRDDGIERRIRAGTLVARKPA